MTNKINFTAVDGINYSFDLSLATKDTEDIPLDQYENLAKIYELAQAPRTEANLIKLNRVLFEFFIKDFLIAYPDHVLSKYFDPIEGLSEEGIVKVARFIGTLKNIDNILIQFKDIIEGVLNGEPNRQTKRANREKNRQVS